MTIKTKRLKRERLVRARAFFQKTNSGIVQEIALMIFFTVRQLVFKVVNFCFRITPTPEPREMLAWAYSRWAGIGAVISLFLYHYKMHGNLDFTIYLLMGISFGGFIGVFVSLFKGIREKEHGNPYFPT